MGSLHIFRPERPPEREKAALSGGLSYAHHSMASTPASQSRPAWICLRTSLGAVPP